MTNLQKDVLVGVLFFVGIFGFMSGEFIMSTIVFASTTVFSTIEQNFTRR